MFFAVSIFLLAIILFAGLFSPFPFFRGLYRDCTDITSGMEGVDVLTILGKYRYNSSYDFSVDNNSGTVPIIPEVKYNGTINVFAKEFEGNCTAYLENDKVIYIESIFD